MVEGYRLRFAVIAATALCARTSAAQGHGGRSGSGATRGAGADVSAIKVSPVGADAGEVAEDRMRAGDCAGALDAFDQALRKNIAPELRRDRGLCHEKLGHPYPAIDDYRAYLDARPSAPDADSIRAKLAALEVQTGQVSKAAAADDKNGKGAAVSMAIGGDSGTGGSLDAIERNEQLDTQADGSPLRRGRGFSLGIAFEARHYGTSGFGADLRYSLSRVSTVLADVTYTHVNGGGTDSSLSGLGFLVGYEARIALNARVDDAFLLGASLGYESLHEATVGFVFGLVEPKVRVGYRHVLGPSLGLEAMLDGGPGFVHLGSAPAGTSGNTTTSVVGGHVGVVLGF
jgi:hypothetical protein